ncbi:MAG: RNA polymerase sigma factor [Gemmobacter sp.]|nr:RNA polymerase sigma factor [Gemmobacter sp.]
MDDASPSSPATNLDPRDLIVSHIPALRAFAISLARNGATADDLVQDTIVRAWTNIEKFTPGTDLKAWMFTILRNIFFSQRRKAVREVSDPDGLHAATLSVAPAHDGSLAFKEFRTAFDRLSAEHREVLILVGANGYSCEEAAAMTGVAVGTVKSRTNRARARLCELLGLEGKGDDFSRPDPVAMAVASALQSSGV